MLVVRSWGPVGLSHGPGCHGETGASVTDDTDISYQAAARGTPVVSSAGTQIGTLEHVLEVPEVDVFDGIVIATKAGLRFIDADKRAADHPQLHLVQPGRRAGGPVAAT